MNIINNYENTLSNAVILGRTMFKGNRDVDTLQDLGTTMNIPMSSKIITKWFARRKCEIYYSTNGNAYEGFIKCRKCMELRNNQLCRM